MAMAATTVEPPMSVAREDDEDADDEPARLEYE